MMGLFSTAASKVQRPRGTSLEDKMPEDTEPDDTSILLVPFSSHHVVHSHHRTRVLLHILHDVPVHR